MSRHPSSPPRSTAPQRWFAAALLLVLSAPAAHAAEIDVQGFYRARARVFHSLSIDRNLEGYEGTAAWVEHRFWLRPQILINDKIGVFADIKALDNVSWGNQPNPWFDPVNQLDVPLLLTDDLTAPTSDVDHSAPLLDITLWRAWGEVHVGNQRFRIGRVPLHWGQGVWQNDGLGLQAEYGDSADRIQWEGLFNDQIYGSLAFDIHSRGFLNQSDLTWSLNGLAAWRTEQVIAGLNLQYRRSVSSEVGQDPAGLFSADLALEAELGPLTIGLEAVARFGSGDLDTGLNDVNIGAGGGVVDIALATSQADLRLRYALATGDGNRNDSKLKTFSFDRDYNFGLILFEQPMPTLAAGIPTEANGGRDYDSVQTGYSVANAMVFAPEVSRTVADQVEFRVLGVLGMVAKVPDLAEFTNRRYYGTEIDLSVGYVGLEHLDLVLTGAVLFPGGYIKNAEGLDLRGQVWGGQLNVRFEF